jgi:hypothetical protein
MILSVPRDERIILSAHSESIILSAGVAESIILSVGGAKQQSTIRLVNKQQPTRDRGE